jgi:hypothetical protein
VRVGEFVAEQRAVFVVLVRSRSEDVAEHAGHGARRDAALGVFETEISIVVISAAGTCRSTVVTSVRQNQFAAVDLDVEIQIVGIDA